MGSAPDEERRSHDCMQLVAQAPACAGLPLPGRQHAALEQLVVRLSLEPGVSSVSWAVRTEALE
jgi:hypothetical protein